MEVFFQDSIIIFLYWIAFEVVLNHGDQFLKISVYFQLSYLENEVGDPYLFLHFWFK